MTKRDPNLDHPAVKKYREICHLTPNHVQRQDIVVTFDWAVLELCFVPEGRRQQVALDHWEAVCKQFMREGNNPKRVDWIMDRYEERIRKNRG